MLLSTMIKLIIRVLLIQCLCTMVTSQLRQKMLRNFLTETKLPFIQKLRSMEICYDTVGCFDIPRHHNPLQKVPEHPEILETKFFLFRRDINFSSPHLLSYSNAVATLNLSKFNATQPVKILVHGYMTKWDEPGALAGAKAYLKIEDSNMILVNWEKGARGPRYSTAAANTELVGRQLGLLLLGMMSLGVRPSQVHLIGFSLGAHVAACASQQLKDMGFLIDRITGLDPASPLFKLNHFRDKRKKLDASDARYVDVIHTDGSPVFTDGFGLLEPLGHVDFFPNGGREQPGCNDVKGAVVVSHFATQTGIHSRDTTRDATTELLHFSTKIGVVAIVMLQKYTSFHTVTVSNVVEKGSGFVVASRSIAAVNTSHCLDLEDKSLDRNIACSHIRAYHIFLETLLQQASGTTGCQFIAYQCPRGPKDFALGHCFPVVTVSYGISLPTGITSNLGRLGVKSSGSGPMYLVTRGAPPFCGSQLQASVQVSHLTKPSRGILFLTIQHGNHTTDFQITCEIVDMLVHGRELNSLAAAEYGSIDSSTQAITATVYYTKLHQPDGQTNRRNVLFVDGITIKDLNGNSWQNCENIMITPDVNIPLKLTLGKCEY